MPNKREGPNLISCRECGTEALYDEPVCSLCGGFLVGSRDRSLGVFSLNRHLDRPKNSKIIEHPVIDLAVPVLGANVAPMANKQHTVSTSHNRGDSLLVVDRQSTETGTENEIEAEMARVAEPEIDLVADRLNQEAEDASDWAVVTTSAWPTIKKVLTGIFYVLFVIAVAIVVNKILRAL